MNKKFSFSTSEKIRLDEFLRRELPLALNNSPSDSKISNSKIRRLIMSGSVSVDGRQIMRPAFELHGNTNLSVNFDSEKFFFEKQPDDVEFELSDKDVLFEDENLIFIDKPAMFPTEQTITGNRANLHDEVVSYLWKRNCSLRNPPYVGIMHRLDRETSGVILFTKNRIINKDVSAIFQSHDFTKEYFAVVEKKLCKNSEKLKTLFCKVGDAITVEKFIGRVSGKSQTGKWGSLKETRGGQYSKTNFKILKECKIEGKDCFLIECSLFTGRTHQIRVHLSEEGMPILGDNLYGGSSAKRMYLHAARLSANSGELNFDVRSPVDW